MPDIVYQCRNNRRIPQIFRYFYPLQGKGAQRFLHKVHDTERMGESGMGGSGIHITGKPQMGNPPEALKIGGFHHRKSQSLHHDEILIKGIPYVLDHRPVQRFKPQGVKMSSLPKIPSNSFYLLKLYSE